MLSILKVCDRQKDMTKMKHFRW